MIKIADLITRGGVAELAGPCRFSQSELTRMLIFVALMTLARDTTVAGWIAGAPILIGGTVTGRALRVGMGPGQRPSAVVDIRPIPTRGAVALRAPALLHLRLKLIAVWIGVATGTGLFLHLEGVTWPRILMTA